MTGATLIVRKGNRYVMTKVANDGDDIYDHLDDLKQFIKTAPQPEEVTRKYLELRRDGQFQCVDFDPCDPLGTDEERCRIVRDYLDTPDAITASDRMDDELNADVDDLDEDDPKMQLGCSYCDYFTFIDLDTGDIKINDEEA